MSPGHSTLRSLLSATDTDNNIASIRVFCRCNATIIDGNVSKLVVSTLIQLMTPHFPPDATLIATPIFLYSIAPVQSRWSTHVHWSVPYDATLKQHFIVVVTKTVTGARSHLS